MALSVFTDSHVRQCDGFFVVVVVTTTHLTQMLTCIYISWFSILHEAVWIASKLSSLAIFRSKISFRFLIRVKF